MSKWISIRQKCLSGNEHACTQGSHQLNLKKGTNQIIAKFLIELILLSNCQVQNKNLRRSRKISKTSSIWNGGLIPSPYMMRMARECSWLLKQHLSRSAWDERYEICMKVLGIRCLSNNLWKRKGMNKRKLIIRVRNHLTTWVERQMLCLFKWIVSIWVVYQVVANQQRKL